MTKPTITYGHQYLDDCNCADPTTFYTENRFNMEEAHATPSILHGDILRIDATFDDGATDEYCNYEKNITNFESNDYPYFMVRWLTSASEDGAKAKVILGFTSENQVILDESYSTTWKVTTGTITPDKTVDKVYFYAEDDGTNGTFQVYYDFILLHRGTFTFPSVSDGIRPRFSNRYVDIEIPGRVGDITQYLGAKSPEIILTGNIKKDTGWGTPPLQYLYENHFNAHQEPWQWFTSDLLSGKVTVRDFNPFQIARDSQRVWELRLKMFDGHCGSNEWVWNYYGFE